MEPIEIYNGVVALVAQGVTRSRETEIAHLIKEDTKFAEDLGLDSLDLIELIMMAEDHFNIEIDDETASGVKTVGHLIKAVEIGLKNAGPRQ